MPDRRASRPVGAPPDPAGARTFDDLTRRLRELQAWSGVSYRELHRRVARARAARGAPEAPVFNTVYRALQPGRVRLDVDLLVDIAGVLLGDEAQAGQWRQAHQAIASQAGDATVVAASDTLPADLPEFTGRSHELDRLLRLFDGAADGGAVVISAIEGMAGVGKTTLAVRAAHRLRGRFGDLQLSVNLRGYDASLAPADPAAVLDAFLRRLDCPPERIAGLDLAGRAEEYRARLAGRRALILLDNAASEEQVSPLLPDSPGCVVLATSRRTLSGLPRARHLALDVFTAEEALAMLRRAAGSGHVDAAPETAGRLAEAVGRLPLALGLVASRIRSRPDWALADHLGRLVERRESLRLDDGVEAALALSYQDLSAERRRVFRLLALVPGRDFDAFVAAALTGSDLDTARRRLDALLSSNLLQQRTPGRYEFHDLVRVHATNLAHDEDPASARKAALIRLFDHYRHAAARAMDRYAPHERQRRPQVPDPGAPASEFADREAATAWLDTERANLVAAAVRADELGCREHTSDLSTLLFRYLDISAHHRDAEALHGRAARNPDPRRRAQALTNLANGFLRTGRHHDAAERLREALALWREQNDTDGEGRALGQLGSLCERLGRYQEALDHFRGALACSEKAGDRRSVGVSLNNIGVVHEKLAEHSDALEHYHRAAAVLGELGDRRGEGRILNNLGTLYGSLGRHAEAREQLVLSLAVAREVGDRRGEAAILNDLGAMSRLLGSPLEALRRHGDALAIAEEFAETYEQARAADGLGCSHADLGDVPATREHWQRALDLYTRMQTPEAEDVAARLRQLDRPG